MPRGLPELAALSLAEKAGQVVWPSLRLPPAPYADTEGPDRFSPWIEEIGPGGVALFGGSVEGVRALLAKAQAASRVPLLVASDFERGVAQQIDGATEFPAFMAFGAADDEALARRAGAAVGAEARAVGVHVVCAPVLDVASEGRNPIVDTRALSDDPERVARIGAAFALGLQDAGVLATAKHFPGHGSTTIDTHLALARIDADLETAWIRELRPFSVAVKAGVAAVMVGHLSFPAVEPDAGLPATLSRNVVAGLLRERLGFRGLVVTDAFCMAAARAKGTEEDGAVLSLAAGCDVILYPTDPVATVRRVVGAVERGELTTERLDDAAGRVLHAKGAAGLGRSAGPTTDPVGTEGTRALAAEVAERSLTLVGADRLPAIEPGGRARFVLVDDDETGIGPKRFADAVRRIDPSAVCEEFGGSCSREPAHAVVLFTAVRGFRGRPVPGEKAIAQVRVALGHGAKLVAILGSPFAVRAIPKGRPCLVAYGIEAPSVDASVAALYGRARPGGRMPIRLRLA